MDEYPCTRLSSTANINYLPGGIMYFPNKSLNVPVYKKGEYLLLPRERAKALREEEIKKKYEEPKHWYQKTWKELFTRKEQKCKY